METVPSFVHKAAWRSSRLLLPTTGLLPSRALLQSARVPTRPHMRSQPRSLIHSPTALMHRSWRPATLVLHYRYLHRLQQEPVPHARKSMSPRRLVRRSLRSLHFWVRHGTIGIQVSRSLLTDTRRIRPSMDEDRKHAILEV